MSERAVRVLRGGDSSALVQGETAPSAWLVLMVDDEPQVHEVTEMVLSRLSFEGRPVELHRAYSAEQAKEFLLGHPDTALVLLDVVMETDDAGLLLCRDIREQLGNGDVQIVLRTGQPGQAPEPQVVLEYDINGYFLKTEMTAQKVHSVVISALRSYRYIRALKQFRQSIEAPGRTRQPSVRNRSQEGEELSEALAGEQLVLLARPQFSLRHGRVVSLELSAVWPRRDGRVLTSAETLALAEREGLAEALGSRLLGQAFQLQPKWSDAAGEALTVCVRLSGSEIRSEHLAKVVEGCNAESSEKSCTRLAVVVDESDVAGRPHAIARSLRRLRKLGLTVVVDGFGIGPLSVVQLKQLHPDCLRIDRSFVRGLPRNPDSCAVTRSIIALAHTMGISVVAAGVQTREQMEFLKWEECETAEGSFFAGILPVEDVSGFLRRVAMEAAG